ncbi:MAG: DUF4388 domain-containing protein [Acidobacteriota bacterium]|nr:DUF4388 domain-containing protein [Acidobacteriota bacterium]
MNKKFQYRASLAETTLPEMLQTIHRFRVPGIIEARNDQIIKRVFLRDGYVIHAASNDRNDSLGEHLMRGGKLTAAEHRRLAEVRSREEKRFGVLLLEQRLLTPAEVYAAIRGHIEEIVWSLFYWEQGEVSFSVGDSGDREMVQIQLPLRRVILEGIERAPEAKPLVGRLGRKDTVFEPSFRWEQLIELALDEAEYRLLTAVDGKKTLYDLCSLEPLSAAENAKLLYAFVVLRLVRRAGAVAGTSTGRVKVQLNTGGGDFSA